MRNQEGLNAAKVFVKMPTWGTSEVLLSSSKAASSSATELAWSSDSRKRSSNWNKNNKKLKKGERERDIEMETDLLRLRRRGPIAWLAWCSRRPRRWPRRRIGSRRREWGCQWTLESDLGARPWRCPGERSPSPLLRFKAGVCYSGFDIDRSSTTRHRWASDVRWVVPDGPSTAWHGDGPFLAQARCYPDSLAVLGRGLQPAGRSSTWLC